jgi:hypothetical protein
MGVNPSAVKYVAATFSGDVDLVEDWLMDRIDWLDSNMIGADCILNQNEIDAVASDVIVYPNPTSGICTVTSPVLFENVKIRSNTGEIVAIIQTDNRYVGEKIILDLQGLVSGMYSLEFVSSEVQFVKKIAIVH